MVHERLYRGIDLEKEGLEILKEYDSRYRVVLTDVCLKSLLHGSLLEFVGK